MQLLLRTFLFAVCLQLVRSPIVMLAAGVGIGMYVEHSRPGSMGVMMSWAEEKTGGALSGLNPFAALWNSSIAQPSSEWDSNAYRVH